MVMNRSSKVDPVFVIAEAGVNHCGRLDLALDMIRVAKDSGADAIKFQTFSAKRMILPGTPTVAYQSRETGLDDQYKMLEKLELSDASYKEIVLACVSVGIEFMSTGFDEIAVDKLVQFGIRRLKIPSGEITNRPLLAHCAQKNLPIILSTGMSDMEDIGKAIDVILNERQRCGISSKPDLTILHCTSDYPASLESANLRAMPAIYDRFAFPVGYSDHTEGSLASFAAVAMGATVIEKHFTLDKKLPGPDHSASLEPNELKDFIAGIRNVERALGTPEKKPTSQELITRQSVRKSLVLCNPLSSGSIIHRDSLRVLRPGNGISPMEIDHVVGSRVRGDLSENHLLQWSDIE